MRVPVPARPAAVLAAPGPKRAALLAGPLTLALLAGCASAPAPPGTQVPEQTLLQTVQPGVTTMASVRAAFGPTTRVVFDSGRQVWVYQSPAPGGRFSEFVILFDPAGVVAKVRRRAPDPFDEK